LPRIFADDTDLRRFLIRVIRADPREDLSRTLTFDAFSEFGPAVEIGTSILDFRFWITENLTPS